MRKDTPIMAQIPLLWVGPVQITGELNESVEVPLATFESPLWDSCERGMKVANKSGGIQVTILHESMTRSLLFETSSAKQAKKIADHILSIKCQLASRCEATSRHLRFIDLHIQIVAKLLYVRLSFTTHDASGHNMTTIAAQAACDWLLETIDDLRYVSISGNICCDKKVSCINGILGRGKSVVAEVVIPRKICQCYLKCTPEEIVNLNIKKNFVGSLVAGSIRSANAHFANMLLALYLATGQDGANIVEGSQGITYCEILDDKLYFSVSLPNLIVGTVGNGKNTPFVQEILDKLGCLHSRHPGHNARRLAAICACCVLAGELSLLAAQVTPQTLIDTHIRIERKKERK